MAAWQAAGAVRDVAGCQEEYGTDGADAPEAEVAATLTATAVGANGGGGGEAADVTLHAETAGEGADAGAEGASSAFARQISELLAAGEWARCEALLERALVVTAAAAAAAEWQGGETSAATAAAAAAPVAPVQMARDARRELLRAFVAARIHMVMAGATAAAYGTRSGAPLGSAGGGGSGSSGVTTATAAASILRWAEARLGGAEAGRTGVVDGSGAAAAATAATATAAAAAAVSPVAAALPLQRCAPGSAEVRTWFRRLAALVHPDKCRTGTSVVPEPVAASAFRLLQDGCSALMTELAAPSRHGGNGDGGGGRYDSDGGGTGSRKRPRDAWRGGGGGGSEHNVVVDGVEEEEDAWWAEWRDCPASSHGGALGAAAAGLPTTCPSGRDEEPLLWTLGLEELRAEVALRQSAVLRPPPDSAAAALDIHARQRLLRVARSVLAERTRAEVEVEAEAVAAGWGGGGFFRV